MSVTQFTFSHDANEFVVRRGVWIDVLLVAAGLWCAPTGWPALGAALIALGLVLPAVRWFGARRGSAQRVRHLVPTALMDSHAAVLIAAALPGVADPHTVIETADDVVLEVAAVLAGRPPRGATQRRFVESRVRMMKATTAELRERHHAWTEARAEVDSIASGVTLPAIAPQTRDGLLVRFLVVTLFPLFAAWDLVQLTARGAIGLCDGVALRLRTIARIASRAALTVAATLRDLSRRWTEVRTTIVRAVGETRHRFVATRVRVRIRLRQARRRLNVREAGEERLSRRGR